MKAYHLDLCPADLNGARIAILPGDPFRVPRIAAALDPEARELAFHREYRSALAQGEGGPVLVISTGIGGPSTAIAVEELATLGVECFVRVGTTGAIQPRIAAGELIVAAAAVRLDGASRHYAPIEFPAAADHRWVAHLDAAAARVGVGHHVGVVVSSDTFYPGQERYDSFTGHVPRALRGSLEEWTKLGCLAYEMEAATLFTVARAMGLAAGCLLGVVLNRNQAERVDPEVVKGAEDSAISCVAEAVDSWAKAQ